MDGSSLVYIGPATSSWRQFSLVEDHSARECAQPLVVSPVANFESRVPCEPDENEVSVIVFQLIFVQSSVREFWEAVQIQDVGD